YRIDDLSISITDGEWIYTSSIRARYESYSRGMKEMYRDDSQCPKLDADI
ncbi:hypothetical protein Taro_003152, partial [Colocasia esculenta]|nr:hypothetical protein [Colocasia esculenta]